MGLKKAGCSIAKPLRRPLVVGLAIEFSEFGTPMHALSGR
jgi:hypothetical protein